MSSASLNYKEKDEYEGYSDYESDFDEKGYENQSNIYKDLDDDEDDDEGEEEENALGNWHFLKFI